MFFFCFSRTQVHEADIVASYPLLREYLITFVSRKDGLPDLEHHKAGMDAASWGRGVSEQVCDVGLEWATDSLSCANVRRPLPCSPYR